MTIQELIDFLSSLPEGVKQKQLSTYCNREEDWFIADGVEIEETEKFVDVEFLHDYVVSRKLPAVVIFNDFHYPEHGD